MKHPSDRTLALYAGRDLAWPAHWWTGRHLAACERCRREVAAYQDLRDILPELGELPPTVGWNRLAAEMKANIRLGLEAGECVRAPQSAPVSWFGARALVAYASAAVLVFGSFLLVERPAPRAAVVESQGVVLKATSGGIEWSDGRQGMRLMHARADQVTYSVSAKGSMRARYVDPSTGYVTINNVYAE